MSQYFPPSRSHGVDIKVELDLTKQDLTNISHADISSFATKTNLASLKIEIDKLDVN